MTDYSDNNSHPTHAVQFLLKGYFRFRRLEEAHTLAKFFADSCPNPRMTLVGISEILVNAIEHGNLGITSEEKSKLQLKNNWLEEIDRRLNLPEHLHQFVEIEFTRTETEICLKVRDQGTGFNWKHFDNTNPIDPLRSHGRGILVAKKLVFKHLEYSTQGNEVTCVISLVP